MDITPAIKQLTFSTGQGIKAKRGALGMSLQTPRILTAADEALLRGGASPAVSAYRTEVDKTPAARKAKAEAEAAVAGGVTLRFVNYRKPFTMLAEIDAVLAIIDRVAAIAIPHLEKALRKKSPFKSVLEKALARLRKAPVSETRSRSARGGAARG